MQRIINRRIETRFYLMTAIAMLGALVLLSSASFAKVMRMSLREKVQASELIAQGAVTSVVSMDGNVKLVELKIGQILYGQHNGERIRIMVTGEEHEPVYEEGDKVITFLRALKREERVRWKADHGLSEDELGYRTVNKFHGPFYINDELAEKEGPLSGMRSLATEKQAARLKKEIKELLVELKKIEPKASGLSEQELEYIAIGAMTDVAINLTKADEQRLRVALTGEKGAEAKKIVQTLRSRVDEIIQEHEVLLKKYPNSADAHNSLGLIYYETGEVDKALKEWKKAIQIDPNHPDARNNLGSHYGDCGREIEAIEELRRAVRANPYRAIYHYNLAVLYDTSRHKVAKAYGWDLKKIFWKAQKEGDLARKLAPSSFDYATSFAMSFVTARFFGVEDIWTDALTAWRDCLDMNLSTSQESFVYANIGRVYNCANNKEKAIEYLRKSLDLKQGRLVRALLKKIEGEVKAGKVGKWESGKVGE